MQQELVSPTNGDRLGNSIESALLVSPDRRLLSPPYINNGGELPQPYAMFSPEGTSSLVIPPLPASRSISISPLSVSLDETKAAVATWNRLYLARLVLQYQEITERYDLCLSHLRDAVEEVESLRRDNASLRAANAELARRLCLVAGSHVGPVPTTSTAAELADEFHRLSVAEPPAPPPEESPTSVLAFQEISDGGSHRFERRPAAEKQVSLPKSISVRSSGYLKLNPAGGAGSAAKGSGRFRVSNTVMLGSEKRVHVGGRSNDKEERGREDDEEEGDGGGGGGALELEVYHQGMFKTELCNKWEESGECPYGDHCQFAHGLAELRPVLRHPRYKTELCRMVLSGGSCPYGHRCHFRHSLCPSDHQRLLRP